MSAERPRASLFSQSTFPAPISPSLLASSPTLNLAATVTNGNTLSIRRAHGELVSSTAEKGRAVQSLRWKSDGQFLAVGWDDGTVRLLGVENTKVVHRINVAPQILDENDDAESITSIAWARNLTGKDHFGKDSTRASQCHAQGLFADDKLDLGDVGGKRSDSPVDLPHALTFLEIDASLPKISPLPVSGGTGDDMFVFSTTASLESMFPPLQLEDNNVVDVMIVGTQNGSVHLSIYDSFPIGSFRVPVSRGPSPVSSQKSQEGGEYHLCLHASHLEVSTHCLLLRPSTEHTWNAMYLVPMDLRFVSYSPVNLCLLASKTTTLQKLLRYIKQAQTHMVNEWQSTRELPSRFLSFIQEDLQKTKSGPKNIVQALYHAVLTGHVHQPVREWLVDSVGERGHKRWEKAVIPSLEALRNLIHENMLPALERSTLILSRLSGIARFHEQDDHIGFTSLEISRLVDIVASLNLICHKILLIVMDELELFHIFSSWLRITIDRMSTSSVSEEIMEKEALLCPGKILRYIEGYLVRSPMAVYFEKVPKEAVDESLQMVQSCTKVLDTVDQQLKLEESGKPYMKALPQMGFLVDLLANKAGNVFTNIAEAEKRSVRFGQATKLELPTGDLGPETFILADMTMSSVAKPGGIDGIAFTAAVSKERPQMVGLFESKIEIINGVSSVPVTTYSNIDLGLVMNGPGGRIIDIKFLNEKILLILWQREGGEAGGPQLLTVRFRHLSEKDSVTPLDFDEDLSSFAPLRMEVLETDDSRGGVPARVCLLGRDEVNYKVFALPPSGGRGGGGDNSPP